MHGMLCPIFEADLDEIIEHLCIRELLRHIGFIKFWTADLCKTKKKIIIQLEKKKKGRNFLNTKKDFGQENGTYSK